MGNQNGNKKSNQLEKQIQEINEWQKNANNPGYFVGNGKVPAPIKNLFNAPLTMIIVGLILLMPLLFNLVNNFNIYNVISNPVGIIISLGLIIGGIIRLIKKF